MVICSLVFLIPEYGFVCLTVSDGLLRHQSLWQCAGWMRASLGCLLACCLKLGIRSAFLPGDSFWDTWNETVLVC